jgi:hypothetical protein
MQLQTGSLQAAIALAGACLVCLPVIAESRGTFYALLLDPHGSEARDLNDPGWGFGAAVAIPLISTGEIVALEAGFDMGNLDSGRSEATDVGGGLITVFTTSQDYYRIFGGAEVGGRSEARIRPHLGLQLALVRQEVSTIFFDTASGLTGIVGSESSTRLGYGLAGGVGLRINAKTSIDGGARFLKGFGIEVPTEAGSTTTVRPDYLQFYVGVTRRYKWPE